MEPRVFHGHDRKAIEVLIDDTAYPGELLRVVPEGRRRTPAGLSV